MNRRAFIGSFVTAGVSPALMGAEDARTRWVALAEDLKPKLRPSAVAVRSIVRVEPDPGAFLRWRVLPVDGAPALGDRLLRRGDSVILDFGDHLTGHFSFAIRGEGRGIDAPTRLKFTFGEVAPEVAEPFDPYPGTLSRAWLQDEVVNIDMLPAEIRLPRRYAFRFVKIECVDTSPNFGVRLSDATAHALTSAGPGPAPLETSDELLRRIDRVSISTLRECMQTVFEDGPKRDRRLWIGDLRLQALTNYATFRNFDLVKRCLYLFAGMPREDGLVPACVFEDPKASRGHEYILDYAVLFGSTVLDYARASNDWQTARELWPVVARQLEIAGQYVTPEGLFKTPGKFWIFIDWSSALDRTAAMHGVLMFGYRQAIELARAIGRTEDARPYEARLAAMEKAAAGAFYDPQSGVFKSGPKGQVSWATQAWMALAQAGTPEQRTQALRRVRTMAGAVRPGAPYLYHYFVDAMLACGMKAEAGELLREYWGGMVKAGADTFWEVYDPADPMLSPYNSRLVNSYCHAWSCTPSYFLRARGVV